MHKAGHQPSRIVDPAIDVWLSGREAGVIHCLMTQQQQVVEALSGMALAGRLHFAKSTAFASQAHRHVGPDVASLVRAGT